MNLVWQFVSLKNRTMDLHIKHSRIKLFFRTLFWQRQGEVACSGMLLSASIEAPFNAGVTLQQRESAAF